MDKYARLSELLKQVAGTPSGTTLFYAEVTAVDGDFCTIIYADLELEEVRLNATGADVTDKLIITPKVGTMALVGSLSGDLRELVVLKVNEPELITYTYGGLEVVIDSTDSKISIKNSDLSLVDLFSSIMDIFTNLTVSTPNGPSGTPLPPTIQAIQQFNLDMQKLLK
jgi:hypothetical protein